ncbi:hypothetical protein SAMN04489724_3029 [Algoriphagus locisalis]|uniref:Uncharacterized protein n=1 Tax=Algoriphagus locisalis TaxID=305507 RepID=A0A1I7CB95_9BACT|nr:hypothetical protein [Algoriphagus locisalis]SFT96664.1 hypothetical protein SAMN04489724_3029 [Algoriphagus locisalis]
MDVPIITFEEIIKLNGHDWDRAYAVLTYHLEKGNIKKEVMENGMVVYHNSARVKEFTLTHDKPIEPDPVKKVVMRPRRK